jgi:hypothetical protein
MLGICGVGPLKRNVWAPTSAGNNSRLRVGSAHTRAIVTPALVDGRAKARRYLL